MSTFGKSSSIKWTTFLTVALLQFGLRTFGAGVIITEEVAINEFSKALLQSVADDLDTSQAHLLHIASVALIVAVKATSELRGGGHEEEKVQQLIAQIREGFKHKHIDASFYNDLADQVYDQLNLLQATVTSEEFVQKIVEIAQRPEGNEGGVLEGASELSSGQALVKQRKDWATIEPEWEEVLKHDRRTKLLASQFYFVLWVVNKLDWDGVKRAKYFSKLLKEMEMDKDGMLRAKHFSINDDVSHDKNQESKIIKKLPDEKKASSDDEERELPDARSSNANVCNAIENVAHTKWCTALKAIDAEFAKWTGMANHLRERLLDGIAETFKIAANSHRSHSKVNVVEQQQNRKHGNQLSLESNQEALALFSVYYARLASLLMPVSGAAAEIGKFNAKLYTSVNNALKKEYRYKQKLDDDVSVVKQ